MTNETAKVKLPEITDYLAIPVRHIRSCSFNIDGSGPESDFCDCGFDLRRDAKTRAQNELTEILNSHTALIEATREFMADSECYCADNVATKGPCGYCKLRTALEKVGK